MLRNKECKQFIILFSLFSVVILSLGFLIDLRAGFLILITIVSFGLLFYHTTKTRYKRIAEITKQLNQILHNEDHLYITKQEEGELSILENEISKMTLRIREQNNTLKFEKKNLADSLADIAHQLRTPLTSVNLILSLMEKSEDMRTRKSYIRETEELLDRMDWLITSLLKISRLDAGIVDFQIKPVYVQELFQASLRPFLISMDLHNITCQINIAPDVLLHGDFEWLTEAFQNIIKNCLESIGENGSLSISCNDNVLYLEIAILDSGNGFQPEDLPHLFDRFYRGSSPNATGYGIGLALCKMIITRQNGVITASNHPDGGALFTIRFTK